jgi:hypothetical protein
LEPEKVGAGKVGKVVLKEIEGEARNLGRQSKASSWCLARRATEVLKKEFSSGINIHAP